MDDISIEQRKQKKVFNIESRGFQAQCWYLSDTEESKGDAYIEVKRSGNMLRAFIYPAYKVFNIAAHFEDIIDGELSKDKASGYAVAGSTGLGGTIMPQEIKLGD